MARPPGGREEAPAAADGVAEASSCDIAWFVMKYCHDGSRFRLEPGELHLTTLERAVEGLTGGRPTSLEEFERVLRAKLTDGVRNRGPARTDRG